MVLLLMSLCVLGQIPDQGGAAAFQIWETSVLPCPAPEPIIFIDPAGDAMIRRTGLNPTALVGENAHNKPDIFAYRTGNWQPDLPEQDLFTGCWDPAGNFLRFDVAFLGLVNPPGLWALVDFTFDPYVFGPNPVFGYVSFDVDNNPSSGGEIDVAASRYLANVARFGGIPADPRFANRVATGGADVDGIFNTPPFIERSGEDFHIALFGDLFAPGCLSVFEIAGNGDCTFDEFETWDIRAPLLHRAHGYERFSTAGGDGAYSPTVTLRFESRFGGLDATVVSLVYPLTNVGAAQMIGPAVPVQPMDGDPNNQNSILEGLQDLVDSVQAIPLGDALRLTPPFALIAPWELQNPTNFLDSTLWDPTIFVSMSYVNQDPLGDVFVWTDAAPGPKVGDFDGNNIVDIGDVSAFDNYILLNDGVAGSDGDVVAGEVTLLDFGHNFTVFDLNYDGIVNGLDRDSIVIRGDMDGDFDVDLVDASILAQVLVDPNVPVTVLIRGDVNEDGAINGLDIEAFVQKLLSPPP